MAHLSRGDTIEAISLDWFHPNLTQHVKQFLFRCATCTQFNIAKGTPLKPGHFPMPRGPFVHLAMDCIDLAERQESKRYCLVLIDRFTRWVEAFPTTHCDAKTVTKLLVREIIPRFGVQEVLSADNGTQFTGDVVKQVAIMMGVDQKFVSIYHPQSNGVAERANQSIKQGLAKTCHSTKKSWVDCVPLVLMKMPSCVNKGLGVHHMKC